MKTFNMKRFDIIKGLNNRIEFFKNKKLDEVCEILHNYGIMVYLSFIVNPLKIKTQNESNEFYTKLISRFCDLKPEMVCGNFLMPFRGTKIWEDYKDLVKEEDFDLYNSKSAFLEKDLINRTRMEYEMFYYQWLYYNSEFYKENVRSFHTGDTLEERFIELRKEFEGKENKLVLGKNLLI